MNWKGALLIAPVSALLIGYDIYKKPVIEKSKFAKRLLQELDKELKENTKPKFSQLLSKQTLKRLPVSLKKRLETFQKSYNQSFLLDHSLASAFGLIGQLINSQVTVRLFLIYAVIHMGHSIVQNVSIITGKSLYGFDKFQYFSRLMVYGIIGTFAVSSISKIIQFARSSSAIVAK